MAKLLLFGSSGFLGKNLIRKLNQEIFPVNIRDNSWNLSIPSDIDIFINCIGKAHDHKNVAAEKDFYFANYEVVQKLFFEFLKSEATLFIHISSLAAVEEYEREEVITENSMSNPVSFYGKSKKEAEDFLLSQHLPLHKKLIILRPSMIHGEGDKGNLILLNKIISSGIPYPFAAFNNQRSFISLDNVGYLINLIIANSANLQSGIYNIADDEPVATTEIIKIIGEVYNKKPVMLKLPKVLVSAIAKIGDIIPIPVNTFRLKKMTTTLIVSNHKIKTALGIKSLPLSAEDGLKKTIESFKNTVK